MRMRFTYVHFAYCASSFRVSISLGKSVQSVQAQKQDCLYLGPRHLVTQSVVAKVHVSQCTVLDPDVYSLLNRKCDLFTIGSLEGHCSLESSLLSVFPAARHLQNCHLFCLLFLRTWKKQVVVAWVTLFLVACWAHGSSGHSSCPARLHLLVFVAHSWAPSVSLGSLLWWHHHGPLWAHAGPISRSTLWEPLGSLSRSLKPTISELNLVFSPDKHSKYH